MKAVIWTAYGPPDVLRLGEVEKPAPRENEVLVRICATTVTAGDCETRSLRFPLVLALPIRVYAGFRRPQRLRILGQELAGEIEAVGSDVRRFKPGDQIFAALGFSMGAYAEYICLPEEGGEMGGVLARKPANVSYEEAASVPVGGLNALHFLRQGSIQPGEKVLINGAGGGIGTIAVQLARHCGAEVTGVDSGAKLDMLRATGADHAIDYTQEDFTRSGETYDVIFDVVGKGPFSGCVRSLNENGRYLIAYPRLSQMVRGRWTSATSGKRVIGGNASYSPEALTVLKELIEAGAIKPVIDRRYSLAQMAEAHRYVETGQKQGNVVITVPHDSGTQ